MQATYWQVVTFKDQYCCFRTGKNNQAALEWVGKRLMSLLMHTLDIKLKSLIAYGVEKWGIRLAVDQAYKANVRAMEKN